MNVMTLVAISFISTGAGVGLRFILRSKPYQNNSLVLLEDIGEGHDALFCIANLTACCQPPYSLSVKGNWYFPNGTQVPSTDSQWGFYRDGGTPAQEERWREWDVLLCGT